MRALIFEYTQENENFLLQVRAPGCGSVAQTSEWSAPLPKLRSVRKASKVACGMWSGVGCDLSVVTKFVKFRPNCENLLTR